MYEPGLYDVVEVITVLSTTFSCPVTPTGIPPPPVKGPAGNLQPLICEAMGTFPMAAETYPLWLHFFDESTADVAFSIGPVTDSALGFQAVGDTVEIHYDGDLFGDSSQMFSGRMYREDQSWIVARETVLQVLARFGISVPPDS
jgi:hypothetical protein